MEIQLSPEQIIKAKACKCVDELLALAKDNGIDMTEAQAMNCFAQLHPSNGELADSELETVAGGCGGRECPDGGQHDWYLTGNKNMDFVEQKCSKCGKTDWIGTIVPRIFM